MKKLLPLLLVLIWLSSCNQKETEKPKDEQPTAPTVSHNATDANFLALAKSIAQSSQQALGNQLKAKLLEGGPDLALAFCSENAIPITDSLAKAHNAIIHRVSDQNRNPNNLANSQELAYINAAKQQLANGQQPAPTAESLTDRDVAYLPIVTNAMCLQCHGTPGETLSQATHEKILSLYPDDKATGYAADQLRGIWVIEQMKP